LKDIRAIKVEIQLLPNNNLVQKLLFGISLTPVSAEHH
jgi:hypothetical protein